MGYNEKTMRDGGVGKGCKNTVGMGGHKDRMAKRGIMSNDEALIHKYKQ